MPRSAWPRSHSTVIFSPAYLPEHRRSEVKMLRRSPRTNEILASHTTLWINQFRVTTGDAGFEFQSFLSNQASFGVSIFVCGSNPWVWLAPMKRFHMRIYSPPRAIGWLIAGLENTSSHIEYIQCVFKQVSLFVNARFKTRTLFSIHPRTNLRGPAYQSHRAHACNVSASRFRDYHAPRHIS
jgi:hypothetical protein